MSADNEAMSVPIQVEGTPELGEPRFLWAFDFRNRGRFTEWEVFGDGDRFLVVADRGIQRSVEVVLNWPLALEQ